MRLRASGPKAQASLLSGRRLMIVLAKFLPTRLVLRRREAIALRDAIDARVDDMPRDGENAQGSQPGNKAQRAGGR